ncbi:MAG: hypothetical protein QOE70_1024 [Chthoniobacter sp.]|jgi:hypothetical protein|nr:hypothetical protein [Chthoniobacter sp.]
MNSRIKSPKTAAGTAKGWGLALACLLLPAGLSAAEVPAEAKKLLPFLTENCLDCHDSETKKGGLDLEKIGADFAAFDTWVKVHDRTRAGEMPPPKKARPEAKELDGAMAALASALTDADAARQQREGRVGLRRLSRGEFENTLRDVLAVPGLRVLNDLPADGKSHGFDRSAGALDFSFVHMAKYLAAVDAALDAATPAFAEKPPVFTYRWSLLDEAGIAILVGQKEAIGLIGLTRDETFAAKYPKIIDEEPKATAIGVFRHGDADFRYATRVFTPVLDGWHRIRVSGYSFGWDGEKVVPTTRHGALSFGIFSKGLNFGLMDLPPNKAAVVELTAWLERGGGMTHGVSDTLMFTPESCERLRDYAHGKNKDVPGPLKPAPGVAIEWIEIEGPLSAEWPPASQRALFGDLPVAEWTKESGVPRPAQQTWLSGKHPSSRPEDLYGTRNEKRPVVHVISTEPEKDARRLLASFLRRAFRRAVTADEIEFYAALFSARLNAGDHFQDALKAAYRAALTSPDSLLLRGSGPAALASRLSYFLWAGPPDDELLALADQGELSKPAVLRAQAERLLRDPKAARFVEDFTGQWLRLREIDATQPDKQLYPEFTPLLQQSMLDETRAYFTELLRADLGVAHFVKSDFAMLNEPLARHYGIPGVEGHEMRRVAVPPGSWRGPFLTQGSVLKVTANGTTTSPVTRGAFVMEKILGIVPTPPPPGTGSIEPDTRGTTTVREQLEKHKTNATCAGCHLKMDPYGFALESFDVIGEWRDKYRAVGGVGRDEDRKLVDGRPIAYHFEKPVDSSGQLPDGRTFQDFVALRDLLAGEEEPLARAFLGHLIGYATGAPVSFADRPEVERILARAKAGHYGVRTLLLETALSPLFSKP